MMLTFNLELGVPFEKLAANTLVPRLSLTKSKRMKLLLSARRSHLESGTQR